MKNRKADAKFLRIMKLKRRFAALFVVIALLSGCSGIYSKQPVYYGYFANALRTKQWNVPAPKKLPRKVWSYEDKTMNQNAEDFFGGNGPTIANGVAYFGGNGITALDIKTGKQIWHSALPEYSVIYSSPLFYKGRLFVVGGSVDKHSNLVQKLLAVDAKSGKSLWKSGEIGLSGISFSDENPIIINGKIYLGVITPLPQKANAPAPEGHVRVWDAISGKVTNEIVIDPKADVFFDTLATDGRYLYGSLIKGYSYYSVFCYDTGTNKVKWVIDAKDKNRTNYRWPRLAISSGVIIVSYLCIPKNGISPNELTVIKAYDIKTHKLLWRKETCCISKSDSKAFYSKYNPKIRFQYFQRPDFAVEKGRIYYTVGDGRIVCADLRSGKELFERTWSEFQGKVKTEKGVVDYPEINFYATDDVLYIATEIYPNNQDKEGTGIVIALNGENGKTLWKRSINAPGSVVLSIVPVKSGMLITWVTDEWAPKRVPVTFELWD